MSSQTAPPQRTGVVRQSILASILVIGLGALSMGACDDAITSAEARRLVASSGPELAIAWNGLGYEIAYAEDEFLTFKGQRALAMMHLAMHDALQAVAPIYETYAYEARQPEADPFVAAAQAASDILLAVYPDRQDAIEAELEVWLAGASDETARERGRETGAASARALLGARADDGWDEAGSYAFRESPGEYRTTPPWEGFTLQPGFRYARPFTFDDPARFRPATPPALDSREYADALAEVRTHGDSSSTVRSDDQTGYAVWWMEFSESAVGRLVRRLLAERKPTLWDANRMLAHMYTALYDGYVSNWDSKYEFNHWRPYTAIREAGAGGSPATEPDPDWVPLRATPPFPEYASAHATGCAVAYEVATRFFGDDVGFENTSLTAPPGMTVRTFSSFRAAAAECADSRIQLGWHFRYSTEAGLEAGRRIAHHVMDTMLATR